MSPPQPATTPTTTTEPTEQQTYLEVWGDTVNGRHLAISVAVGSVVGASALLAAQALFERVVSEPSLAQAYSFWSASRPACSPAWSAESSSSRSG